MEAADFQPFLRNVFTEMELPILNHFETNSGCPGLKDRCKILSVKGRGITETKTFSLF